MDYNNRKLEISQANPNFFLGIFLVQLEEVEKSNHGFSWKLKFSMGFPMVFLDPNGSDPFPGKH